VLKKLFGDNETNALGGSTLAGIASVIHQIKAVVESKFLTGPNVPQSKDPDSIRFEPGFTVR
jgi:hypothetical protein